MRTGYGRLDTIHNNVWHEKTGKYLLPRLLLSFLLSLFFDEEMREKGRRHPDNSFATHIIHGILIWCNDSLSSFWKEVIKDLHSEVTLTHLTFSVRGNKVDRKMYSNVKTIKEVTRWRVELILELLRNWNEMLDSSQVPSFEWNPWIKSRIDYE